MSSKIELGFDYADGKHIPTIKISLEPCGPDGLVWDERDMLGNHIEKLLAAPVVERQREIDGVNCPNPECSALIPYGAKCKYCEPSELTELQATIARLHEVSVVCATAEQERDQLKAEIERLKGGQGEPFDMAVSALNDIVKVFRMGEKPFEIATLAIGEMSAIASQPAPVSVVLPSYRTASEYSLRVGKGAKAEYLANEWNACLDKVMELNQ